MTLQLPSLVAGVLMNFSSDYKFSLAFTV